MSMHFNVSEMTRSLLHSLRLDRVTLLNPLGPDQQLLVDHYLSGHIPESAWRDYVFAHPHLEKHVEARRQRH